MKMNVITVLGAVLLVALFMVDGEAKPFGRGRPGGRAEDGDAPDCPRRRCPRPTRRSRVCVEVDGRLNRTMPSTCRAEVLACRTGSNITLMVEGACTRPVAPGHVRALRVQKIEEMEKEEEEEEDDSKESDSEESNEDNDEETTTLISTTSGATASSAEPTMTVTNTGTVTTEDSITPGSTDQAMTTTFSGTSLAPSGPSVTGGGVTGPGALCTTNCPLVSEPVCGSDGSTYQSRCVLESYACSNGLDSLTVADEGVCPP